MAVAVADTAAWEPERRQLLAVPAGDNALAAPERAALAERGFTLEPAQTVADGHGRAAFELYLVR